MEEEGGGNNKDFLRSPRKVSLKAKEDGREGMDAIASSVQGGEMWNADEPSRAG